MVQIKIKKKIESINLTIFSNLKYESYVALSLLQIQGIFA